MPAYVDAIEGYLGRLRGRPVSLVGHEFALARDFHAAGVSLASVLSAIDRGREAAGPVVSLSFCSRFLRGQVRPGSAGAVTPEAPPRGVSSEAVRATLRRLEALVEALSREEWREDVTVGRLLEQARALLRQPPADVDDQVLRIDRAVDAWISAGLAVEEVERCRRELHRSLARAASSTSAVDEAVRREAARRVRERLRLPRLT